MTDQKVTVFCYGKEETFDNAAQALKKYMEGVACCEGSERERYMNIVTDLYDGQNLCIDDYDEYLLKHPEMVACPYCGRPKPNTGNKDELCEDCKSVFGHSLVTEL